MLTANENRMCPGAPKPVPGTGFGAHGHIRFSFAVSMQTLEKALERMGRALRGG